MSVRNALVLLLALSTLSLLVGCGSSSSPTATPPPGGGFSNSNLSGTYVFSVTGTDVNGAPYAIVGTFMANGSTTGGITGGTVDIVDPEYTSVFGASINNNGQYTVGVDGRGTMTIGMANNPFGANMTFDFVLQNSSHGLITQFDGNASGSGTIDAQTSSLTQASLAGPFAFSFSGVDGNTGNPLATVGAFTLDQNGNITAGGGAEDFNDANIASPYSNAALTGGVALGPSSTPATVLSSALGSLTFDVYAIDSTHLKFIETDLLEYLSGDAYSQTSTAVPTGTLAFTLSGFLPFNGSSSIPFAAGGFMVTDGSGDITVASSEDYNSNGSPSPAPFSFTASYSNSGSIIPGRFILNNFATFIGGTEYAAYPSSGGTLLLEIDDGGILFGAAYNPQTSTAFTPPQGFGLNLTGLNLANGVEVDDIAEFSTTATTCNSSSATFCGLMDENADPSGPSLGAPIPRQVFDGTFAAPDSNGRGLIGTTTANNTLDGEPAFVFYSVDGTSFPFIEIDANGQVATGVFVLQSSSGASASAAAKSHMFVPRSLVRAHADVSRRKN